MYIGKYSSTGNIQWTSRVSYTVGSSLTNAIDPSGNVFIAASYNSNVTSIYNSGETVATTFPNGGLSDTFIAKYSSTGMVLWTARIYGSGSDIISSLASDSSGNVFCRGSYTSGYTTTMYNSDGTAATTLPSSTSNCYFIAKYSSGGTALWISRILIATGAIVGLPYSATDPSGNYFLYGFYNGGTGVLYNANGSIGATLSNNTAQHIFLAKYSSNGTVLWRASASSTGSETVGGIASDSNGDVYIQAGTSSNLTFYNANGTVGLTHLYGQTSSQAGVLAKYSSAGTALWSVKIIGNPSDANFNDSQGVATDLDGNVIFCTSISYLGCSAYNADGQVGVEFPSPFAFGGSSFIFKYSSAGTVLWGRKLVPASPGSCRTLRITTDSNNNILVNGTYTTALTLYNTNGTSVTLPSPDGTDAFFAKYSPTGTVLLAARISSSGTDVTQGITTDLVGNVFVHGNNSAPVTLYNASLSQ
jgi:hypothetical protein